MHALTRHNSNNFGGKIAIKPIFFKKNPRFKLIIHKYEHFLGVCMSILILKLYSIYFLKY
jgi:hypothetical protein